MTAGGSSAPDLLAAETLELDSDDALSDLIDSDVRNLSCCFAFLPLLSTLVTTAYAQVARAFCSVATGLAVPVGDQIHTSIGVFRSQPLK